MPTASASAEPQATIQRVADAVSPSVVRIGRHGGRGCGVVVADGLVVTNAHNLRDRTTQVTFADGRAVQARATGIDRDGDLTVLAVDTEGTPGAVSSVDRAFRGPRGRLVTGAIEHTAPLARGTSGSPVVDGDGRLVGITTLRLGDGFSIAQPAGTGLRARIDDLAAGREPARVLLGVGVAPASLAQRLRSAVGLPERAGALVRSVAGGSPAAAAGIARGDLIVAIGDHEVTDPAALEAALATVQPGDEVTVALVRGSDELTVTVTFPAAPADDEPADAPSDAPTDEGTEG
jgi:S1-C subfamily serine protease